MGVKHPHRPVVGDRELSGNRSELSADPELSLTTHAAGAGSRSNETPNILSSLAATIEQQEQPRNAGPPNRARPRLT